MDFVWGANPFFDPSRQYCDIVLPVATWWEKGNIAWMNNSDTVYWADRIMEPLFESKPESWIAEELAQRLDVDPTAANTMTDAERTYSSLAGAAYMTDHDTMGYAPLLTITQADIDELGVEGAPQEGLMSVAEFKEKGFFKIPRSKGDALTSIPYKAFYADPQANPLPTSTGKFEIYCAGLAGYINSVGFSTISPIAKWQIGDPEQGAGTQTEEFPLLLWTPHSLRRAHTVNDNVVSLREAFPQECFMSTLDAEARGIKTGDLVLDDEPTRPGSASGQGAAHHRARGRGAPRRRVDPHRRGNRHRLGRRPEHSPGAEVLGRGIPVLDGHAGAGGEVHRPADARPRQEHAHRHARGHRGIEEVRHDSVRVPFRFEPLHGLQDLPGGLQGDLQVAVRITCTARC